MNLSLNGRVSLAGHVSRSSSNHNLIGLIKWPYFIAQSKASISSCAGEFSRAFCRLHASLETDSAYFVAVRVMGHFRVFTCLFLKARLIAQ